MIFTIDDEMGAKIKTRAAEYGRQPDALISELLVQALKPGKLLGEPATAGKSPGWVADIKPAFTPAPGKTWTDYLVGEWPGDETDEDMMALAEMVDD